MRYELRIEKPHLMSRKEALETIKLLLSDVMCVLTSYEDMDDADEILDNAHREIRALWKAEKEDEPK